jgi:hypothetical protein
MSADGRKFRILTITDEASRECLALAVARRLNHGDVLAARADLFIERGPPAHIRSDNGSEFIATAVRAWLEQIGVKALYITPGSPWENGYNDSFNDSFNGSLRDELLNGEIFYGLAEARVLIEHYTPSGRTAVWATSRQPRKRRHRHCRPPVPLRSTSDWQWRRKPQCTNYQPGPPGGGCSSKPPNVADTIDMAGSPTTPFLRQTRRSANEKAPVFPEPFDDDQRPASAASRSTPSASQSARVLQTFGVRSEPVRATRKQ